MNQKTKKQKNRTYFDANPIEAIGRGVASSLASDFGKGMVHDLWDQMLGNYEDTSNRGDLVAGQEIDLRAVSARKKQVEQAPQPFVEPGIDYRREILHVEKKVAKENSQVIETKIQEIIIELKRLTETSKILQAEFREVTTESRIETVGKYHLSFFEWVLSMVRGARLKVEDAGSWLAVTYAKKKKRGYWQMFKKHGTTFGLSHERVVATQTG